MLSVLMDVMTIAASALPASVEMTVKKVNTWEMTALFNSYQIYIHAA